MKNILVLRASEDINNAEIANVVSQISMYGITATIETIDSYETLYKTLNKGISYDYIYLATHGCETSWGNISGSLNIKWIDFAALICTSMVAKEDCVFLHSCCRGGLNQVAWEMFACCSKINYVCGPRHNVKPVELITAFNLFLYNVEIRNIHPVVAADKVLNATDIKLVCFDKVETISDVGYNVHCSSVGAQINTAFDSIEQYELKLAATSSPVPMVTGGTT